MSTTDNSNTSSLEGALTGNRSNSWQGVIHTTADIVVLAKAFSESPTVNQIERWVFDNVDRLIHGVQQIQYHNNDILNSIHFITLHFYNYHGLCN
jgi:hypothetical protein